MSDDTVAKKTTTIAFGFSKTKPKTNLIQSSSLANSKTFEVKTNEKDEEKIELITSLAGNKIQSLNPVEKKGPLIIPCQENTLIIKSTKSQEKQQDDASTSATLLNGLAANASPEDIEAYKALLAEQESRKNTNNNQNSLVIETATEKKEKGEDEEMIEEPDYEKVEIEKFGLAVLRGMGWNEKEGIGKNGKRKVAVYEPELRPKGLGLGASVAKKVKENENEADSKDSLRYVKGALVRIEAGKYDGDYGELVGFDDGLNRILVRVHSTGDTVSLIQFVTRLVTKDEFKKATESKNKQQNSRHESSNASNESKTTTATSKSSFSSSANLNDSDRTRNRDHDRDRDRQRDRDRDRDRDSDRDYHRSHKRY